MGVSQVTVWEAERGRDVRHATLQAFVDALPTLDPAALLGAADRSLPGPSQGTWLLLRDAFGYEAERLVQELVVDDAGDVEQRVEVAGLTTTRGDLRDADLRCTLVRSVFVGSRAARGRITPEALAAAGRRLVVEDDVASHEIVLSGGARRPALTYVARERKAGMFAREALAAAAATPGPALVHGTAQGVTFPVRELVLRVRHGAGRRPAAVSAHAWPRSLSPDVNDPDLLRALHPDATLEHDEAGRTLTLAVPRPLVELFYGLGWEER